MSLEGLALRPEWVVYAFNLAVVATLISAGGLAAAWCLRRRSAPARHGALVAASVLLTFCPGAVWLGQQSGLALVEIGVSGEGLEPVLQADPASKASPEEPPAGRSALAGIATGREAAASYPAPTPGRWAAPAAPQIPASTKRAAVPPAPQVVSTEPPAVATPEKNVPRRPAWWQVAGTLGVGAWLAGSLISAVSLAWGCASVVRLRRQLEPVNDRRVESIAVRAAAGVALRRAPRVFLARHVPVPFSIGLVRPAVVLPGDFIRDLDDGRLHAVLLHEAAHIARRDHWIGLIQRLAVVLFWWCLPVRRVGERISEFREEICDNYVLGVEGGGERLARTLVELAARCVPRPLAPSAVGVMEPKLTGLSGRIARLISKEPNMATRMKPLSVLLTAACAATVLTSIALLGGLRVAQADPGDRVGIAAEKPAEDLQTSADHAPSADLVALTAEGASAAPAPAADRVRSYHYRGRVLGPDGKPVPGAKIYLVYYTPATIPVPKVRAVTDREGNFQFDMALSEFSVKESNGPWLFSTMVAVPPDRDQIESGPGLAIDFQPAIAFETTGKLLQDVLRKYPEVVETWEKPEPVLRLVKDLPLMGRITCKGRAIAGARISMREVFTSRNEDLTGWLSVVEKEKADYYQAGRLLTKSFRLRPQLWSIFPPATTDAEGKFRLPGIGRERIAELLIEGPGIETRVLSARTRPGAALEVPYESHQRSYHTFLCYGAEFAHATRPSIPIVGTVRDKDTGRPLAGVTIKSNKLAGNPIHGFGQDYVQTTTDAEGRYRLTGMPVNVPKRKPDMKLGYFDIDDNEIVAVPPVDQPYLLSAKELNIAEGKDSLQADFQLKQGVWIRGRITDAATGKPVRAQVEYHVFLSNSNSKSAPGYRGVDTRTLCETDAEGRYAVPGLPGRGLVCVSANDHQRYPRGAGAEKIQGGRQSGTSQMFETDPHHVIPFNFHALAEVNPPQGAKSVTQDFKLDPGQTLTGTVLDPEGRPLSGTEYSGQLAFPSWRPLSTPKFTINSYRQGEPRLLQFVHKGRKLAGSQVIEGTQPGPITVRLQPWGVITGQVVDAEMKPQAGTPAPSEGARTEPPYILHAFPGFQPKGPRHGSFPEQYHETDAQGRFRIEGLAPGLPYGLAASSGNFFLGEAITGVTVAPGQTKELGTLKLRMPKPSEVGVEAPKTAGKPEPTRSPAEKPQSRLTLLPDDLLLDPFDLEFVFKPIQVGREPPSMLLRDDFNGKYDLKWKIVREDATHLSLQKHPGCLTITTQRGTIHRDQDNHPENEGFRAKNIFLIANPLAPETTFSVTLCVIGFRPTTPYHQVGVIFYNDDDNYLKWSFEASWQKPGTTNLALVRETNAEVEHNTIDLPTPEKLWLRVTKQGKGYQCAYSTDGQQFTSRGTVPWGDGAPQYLGFLAKNGGSTPAAPEIDARIDYFELRSSPAVATKQPADPTRKEK